MNSPILGIYGDQSVLERKEPCSLVVGNFDGVHKGHVFLLEQMVKESASLKKVVVTFDPLPSKFLRPSSFLGLIIPLHKRVEYLLACQVDTVLVLAFDEFLAQMETQEFLEDFLGHLFYIKKMFVGFNHAFGKNRMGNAYFFQSHSFSFDVVYGKGLQVENKEVSSSLIRQFLSQGYFEKMVNFLGRPYSIEGGVVHGRQVGRQLGFPTANINYDHSLYIPICGVYWGFVILPQERKERALISVTQRPTFHGEKTIFLEAHFLDVNEDVYDKKLEVLFLGFIRSEQRFENRESLRYQMLQDREIALKFF